MSRNIPATDMELIKEIDADFHMIKRLNEGEGLSFESNPPNYWLIYRGDEVLEVSPVISTYSFKTRRNTSKVSDEITYDLKAESPFDRYWQFDLNYIVDEAFKTGDFLVDSDMTNEERRSFFNTAFSFLKYLGETNIEELLSNVSKHIMINYTSADLFMKACRK